MEVTMGALSSVLPKLGSLLKDEFKLQKRVKQEIEFLIQELEAIQGAIPHISKMEKPRPADYAPLRDIRELFYDVDDSVDSLLIRVGQYKRGELPPGDGKRFIDMCKSKIEKIKTRHQISHQIHDLKIRVKEVSELRKRYSIESAGMSSKPVLVDPSVSRMYMDASSSLVGLERPQDELTKLLLMEEEKEPTRAAGLKAVSIVGFGGMGKTTLAQEVYRAIKGYFQCAAWVYVSQSPDMKKILVSILSQVEHPHRSEGDCMGERDLMILIRRINETLRQKRYLLVLDDLWSTGILEIIKSALPLNDLGSRVITTTRSHTVAAVCHSHWNGHIYNMLPLSSKDSWRLFQGRLFSGQSCPQDSEKIYAEKVLEKCGGVPLAISVFSGLLAAKRDSGPECWEDLYNSLRTTTETMEDMNNILLFSYYDLPHHLRLCFLYLSLFPVDYPINCDCLVWCWIAEGFIPGHDRHRQVELGKSYLVELVNRSMIQPVDDNCGGELEAFLIHRLIHDLIKAKSVEENFVTLLDNGKPLSVLQRNIRRLSIIDTNKDDYIPVLMTKSHIRSLFIFGNAGLNLSFRHLKFLRLLTLEGCTDLEDHNIYDIAKLFQLRYLSIRDTPIRQLPDEIWQLQFLETLVFGDTNVRKLPRIQLNSSCYLSRIPEWFRLLASLKYLCIDVKEVKNEDLQLLSELRLLQHLFLLSRTMPTEQLVIPSSGFPVLQIFHLQPAKADLTFEPGAMKNLEKLMLTLHVLQGEGETGFYIDISQFSDLKKIDIRINGKGTATSQYIEALEAVISKATVEHPKHPAAIVKGDFIDYGVEEGIGKEKQMEPID